MARYIDADKLIAHLKDEIDACEPKFDGRANGKSVAYGTELGLKSAISFAKTLATADVVPKSEYDAVVNAVDNSTKEFLKLHDAFQEQKVELEAMRGAANSYKTHYENLAREIFEEIDNALDKARREYRSQLDSNGVIYTNYARAIIAKLKKERTEDEG